MTNREYAEYWFRSSPVPKIEDYEHGLDAAERRGWIAALEWVIRTGYIDTDTRERLAELKAEENKR